MLDATNQPVSEAARYEQAKERRPFQSADLSHDPRARYPHLHSPGAMRSMLATPLLVGDQAIGALTVLRGDIHRFTPEEESLAACPAFDSGGDLAVTIRVVSNQPLHVGWGLGAQWAFMCTES